MGNILKFLIIVIGIFYFIKVIIRFFLPFLFRSDKQSNKKTNKEGEIIIHKKPKIKETPNKKGEYVDFEDVE